MTKREIQVSQELPALEIRVTRSVVMRYTGASTGFNEVHFSDRRARAIGLLEVLTHGMRTMGARFDLITRWIGDPTCIGRYCVRFTRPVVVPDTDEDTLVCFTGTVAAVAGGVATVGLTATYGGDTVLGAVKVGVCID